VKRIGFLSFGHWQAARGSETRTARDAHVQTIELAEAAEEIGLDGAFVRVHHFARQLASPFPLLAAIGARTQRIEIGTAVIDMRYENPLYMAEEAAAADVISGGRLQLGISRGSPEPALRGSEAFGYVPPDGSSDADFARARTELFRAAIAGAGVVDADPAMTGFDGKLPIQPLSPGLPERIWWGSGTRATASWTAQQGMNLMSSTLLVEDTGVPFDELQAEQIALFRSAWAEAGWKRSPRVSVSRSVIPIVSDVDRMYFGGGNGRESTDQVGYLDGGIARFGRQYVGEPDVIAEDLSRDVAVREADTLLLTVPNQLGVEYNAGMLRTIAEHIAPAIGWQPTAEPST
jgi:alkanesulfonate monooxygenase SsuD/methylene tetrahydromethanopterin reductase-like flavin-dependent oxidoreductase (luciferase family)